MPDYGILYKPIPQPNKYLHPKLQRFENRMSYLRDEGRIDAAVRVGNERNAFYKELYDAAKPCYLTKEEYDDAMIEYGYTNESVSAD